MTTGSGEGFTGDDRLLPEVSVDALELLAAEYAANPDFTWATFRAMGDENEHMAARISSVMFEMSDQDPDTFLQLATPLVLAYRALTIQARLDREKRRRNAP